MNILWKKIFTSFLFFSLIYFYTKIISVFAWLCLKWKINFLKLELKVPSVSQRPPRWIIFSSDRWCDLSHYFWLILLSWLTRPGWMHDEIINGYPAKRASYKLRCRHRLKPCREKCALVRLPFGVNAWGLGYWFPWDSSFGVCNIIIEKEADFPTSFSLCTD